MKHLLLVFRLRLFPGNRVASLRIDSIQRDNVMVSQGRNRTHEHCFQSLTLANLSRYVSSHPLVRRASHELERLAHTIFREDVQERRLTELHGQSLLERSVKDRVSGRVDEVRQQDGVLFGQGTRATVANENDRTYNGNHRERGN